MSSCLSTCAHIPTACNFLCHGGEKNVREKKRRAAERRLQAIRKQMKNTVVGPAYDLLSSREDGIIEELRKLASATTWGDYNLAHAGLNDFVAVLKLVPRTAKARRETKRPESDLQYVLWKAIESRAGGCIDLKMSGLDQTNKAGLVSQENASKVFDALMGMYQTDHHIHQWLVLQIRKWEPLANALYDVGCFMKSQRKRSPAICDKNSGCGAHGKLGSQV